MALINGKSRRFVERQQSSLVLIVKCFESDGRDWQETTNLVDVTRSGARFVLNHQVESGQPLFLTLPLESRLRSYDFLEKDYRVWAIARYVIEIPPAEENATTQFRVGAAFIGKTPPEGFFGDMTKRYELKPRPTGKGLWEARQRPRRELF